MKNTVIYTIEVTDIVAAYPTDEHLPILTKAFKDTLKADDVVITKVQVFEGTDEGEPYEEADEE